MNDSLGSRVVDADLLLKDLVNDSEQVGGIFCMGYGECIVITNDIWKNRVGGVPLHCFLIATRIKKGKTPDRGDEEVILLRVEEPAEIPDEQELTRIRYEAMRRMVVEGDDEKRTVDPFKMDVLTENEIQFSGFKAKILGTFYETEVKGRPHLAFGSDVENYYSSAKYQVSKPFGRSLEIIAGYPEITEREHQELLEKGKKPARIKIGEVRYCSMDRSRKRNRGGKMSTSVPIMINPHDFISMKTAIFGMTRMGKSNTIKIIATGIAKHAAETGEKVGQLLFDPQGEYSHPNNQDEKALVELGSEFVTVFRYKSDGTEAGVRPLSVNFYDPDQINVAWALTQSLLKPRAAKTDYVNTFINADIVGPEDLSNYSAAYRAERKRAAFYANLYKAGLQPPAGFEVEVTVNSELLAAINEYHVKKYGLDEEGEEAKEKLPDRFIAQRGRISLAPDDFDDFWNAVYDLHLSGKTKKSRGKKVEKSSEEEPDLKDWVDDELKTMLDMYMKSKGKTGHSLLKELRYFHSLDQTNEYEEEIYQELVAGKIVIVDLTKGGDLVLKVLSERVLNNILNHASERFISGEENLSIQIFLEEAHRLFNRDQIEKASESDPYKRIAKEAAKYGIGLVYATQEVSSVDPAILSNTSNWIATHLNNTKEVIELAKYYDFRSFNDVELNAEDAGFARIKTKSGRYILSTQIDLFDANKLDETRAACLKAMKKLAPLPSLPVLE